MYVKQLILFLLVTIGFAHAEVRLSGEVLFWKARGSNLTYVSDYERKYDFPGINIYHLKTRSLKHDRNVGFRLGASFDDPCGCLDYRCYLTHFCNKAYGHPDKCSFEASDYDTETKWKLHLNFLDFEARQKWCFSDCLSLQGIASVRGAWIKQDYQSVDSYLFLIPDEPPFDSYDINEKHRFYGAGPRVGVDVNWCMGCGVSLYGQIDGAFLVGNSSSCVCDHVRLSDALEQTFGRDESAAAYRFITDFAGGIRWRPECLRLLFQLGWEFHTIFGQKHAHFGQDFIFEDPFKQNWSLERNCGPCKSTLAVYGLTFTVVVEI